MEEGHTIADRCAAFGVSRSGFYAWRQRRQAPAGPRASAAAALGEEITAVFARSRRTYGSPRVFRALRRAGHVCGRHRVARIMRARRLAGRTRGRRRVATTNSDHSDPIAPNRLRLRDSAPTRPDEVWVADITYVPTAEGWLYVAGVLDLYSRKLVGWSMGERSGARALPMSALQMALRQRRPAPGLLHHSDRGCQYASEAYRDQLAAAGACSQA